MAYPTGDAATSAVGIEKGFPLEVRANQPFEYSLVVTNLTDNELSDVVLTETPANNLQITGTNPTGESAGGGMRWALGKLGPRESRSVTLQAASPAEGTAASCAGVSYNSLLCATVPVVQPKLQLVLEGPTEAMRCDELTYTLEVANRGTGTIRDVKVNYPLPEGLTGAGGRRTLSFDAGSLAPGRSRSFEATLDAARTGTFEHRATATGEGVSAEATPVTTVLRQPVLAITKQAPERQYVGSPVTFQIAVVNNGDGEARDTILEDAIPSGMEFVSASDGGRQVRNRVIWDLGTLAPKASKSVTLQLRAASAGSYRNTGTVNAFCADTVTDTTNTAVTGIPAILLEVIDVSDPIRVGDQETYVITVTNQGSAPDTNIRITCTLEANQQFVSARGETQPASRGASVQFQPIPSLAPKAKAEYRVVVKCVQAGDVRFKVSMTSDELTRAVEETEATNIYE